MSRQGERNASPARHLRDEPADDFRESRAIRQSVEHESGKRFGCVNGRVLSGCASNRQIQTARLQLLVDAVSVRPGGNDDRSLTRDDGIADERSDGFDEIGVGFIDLNALGSKVAATLVKLVKNRLQVAEELVNEKVLLVVV